MSGHSRIHQNPIEDQSTSRSPIANEGSRLGPASVIWHRAR